MEKTKQKNILKNNEHFGCSKLIYTPDEKIEMDQINAIRTICQEMHSHENGIPEWVKNSADAYARSNSHVSKRVIILIFDSGRKNISPSISCLDFVGMKSSNIEDYFRRWADPDASKGEEKNDYFVQGGHGNGGKCYMIKMFEDYSYFHTVKNNKGNIYGVAAGSVEFGYIPNKQDGKDFYIHDLKLNLEEILNKFRCSIDILPNSAIKTLETADGFTIFTGYSPKGYKNKIPTKQLIKNLLDLPQMIRSLQTTKIFVIINGKLEFFRKPLTLPIIKPLKGGDKVREIEIPSRLIDPAYGNEISTTKDGQLHRGKLLLYTSEKSMRRGLKALHTIRYLSAQYGDFGYVPVSALEINSPYRERIYGECHLDALEEYRQNMRAELADSSLTRAIQEFIGEEIHKYAKEFEKFDKKKYDQNEKNAVSKMNEFLDKWKNKFLKDKLGGLWGPGENDYKTRKTHLPVGEVARIELSLSHQKAGKGVFLKPNLNFYDSSNKKIRSIPYKWVSEDTNVAMVDENLMLIKTFAFGNTSIYAETLDCKIKSNVVPLEVVHIKEISIVPEFIELYEGGRQRLRAVCNLDDGSESDEVNLVWFEDNDLIAKVSSAGFIFGFNKGETKVQAGDDCCISTNSALIKVSSGKGMGSGKNKGNGYPQVLVSGEFDRDPFTGEYVFLNPDDPPVYQRPEDSNRNIWWINSSSPLAELYLNQEKGYGYESNEWRIYHLERFVDIIVQILISHSEDHKDSLSGREWIDTWMYHVSEIQPVACSDLHDFLNKGEYNND